MLTYSPISNATKAIGYWTDAILNINHHKFNQTNVNIINIEAIILIKIMGYEFYETP